MQLTAIFALLAGTLTAFAQEIERNVPYVAQGHARHVLDIYRPAAAKGAPVVFWIHGGGWQTGDKTSVQQKPKWFTDHGFIFVATNYRLLPEVPMEDLTRDVAKALGWTAAHIAERGGDPKRIVVAGHSAGAQLAALLCTDARYLQAESVPFTSLIGCVPVDGDTYDIPAIIETAETRRRVHGQPQATFGHREKFGNDPAKHHDFSAVTHIAAGKNIPPFLILHVANHPDNSAQASRLASVLAAAGVKVRNFGAKDTDHVKLNARLGEPNDPATAELETFVSSLLKK